MARRAGTSGPGQRTQRARGSDLEECLFRVAPELPVAARRPPSRQIDLARPMFDLAARRKRRAGHRTQRTKAANDARPKLDGWLTRAREHASVLGERSDREGLTFTPVPRTSPAATRSMSGCSGLMRMHAAKSRGRISTRCGARQSELDNLAEIHHRDAMRRMANTRAGHGGRTSGDRDWAALNSAVRWRHQPECRCRCFEGAVIHSSCVSDSRLRFAHRRCRSGTSLTAGLMLRRLATILSVALGVAITSPVTPRMQVRPEYDIGVLGLQQALLRLSQTASVQIGRASCRERV